MGRLAGRLACLVGLHRWRRAGDAPGLDEIDVWWDRQRCARAGCRAVRLRFFGRRVLP